jgi:hypothetical protein
MGTFDEPLEFNQVKFSRGYWVEDNVAFAVFKLITNYAALLFEFQTKNRNVQKNAPTDYYTIFS